MRKLLFTFILVNFIALGLFAQTNSDFIADTVCVGDSSLFMSTSSSTGNILNFNWDIDSNGVFNDANGQIVKWKFGTYKTYKVGLQVISDLPDTAVFYKNVVLKAKPNADFEINIVLQCLTANAYIYTNKSTIASGTMSYFWDLDDGVVTSTAVDTGKMYFISGNKKINLIATSYMGCVDSIKKDIWVLANSKADFNINDTIQCLSNENFIFTDSSTACDPLVSFSWDFNNDGIFGDSTGKSPVSVKFGAAGIHYVGIRIITTTGRDSIYYPVTVLPSGNIDFSVNDSMQCNDADNYIFTNNSTFPSGSLTYLWEFGDGDTSTIKNSTKSYNSGGIYNVKLIGTTDKGCMDSVIKNVYVFHSPKVDFEVNDSFQCFGDTFKFVNKSTISAPWSLTYTWDFGDGSARVSTVDTQKLYTAGGTYTVKLIAVSDSFCSDSITKNMKVISGSLAKFIIDDSTRCFGNNQFEFTNNSTNCSPIDTILWDLDNDGVFDDTSGTNFKYTFTTVGTHPIGMKLITTTDTDSIYQNIYLYPNPVAGFTINDSTQALTTNNFIFTNTSTISTGTLSYLWKFGDGKTAVVKDTNHSYLVSGTFSVKLYATSDKGCADSIAHNAIISQPIAPGFTSTTVCFGDSTQLTDTSKSGSPILQYNWDINGDGVFGDLTGKTVKYLFATADTFKLALEIVTASSSDTAYNNVVVLPSPDADFIFSNACQGAITTFKDTSSIQGGTISKYYWDFDNDGTVDDSSGKYVNNKFSLAGTYSTKLLVVANGSCSDTIVKPIPVDYMPNADFTYENNCVGDSVAFTNISSINKDSIINYIWNYGDGKDAIIRRDHKHYYTTDGIYNVSLLALSDKGCADTTTHTLTIYPNPSLSLNIQGDTIFFKGGSVNVSVVASYDSNFWSNGETGTGITITEHGIYTVRVVDNNNCDDKDSVQVIVKEIPDVKPVDVFTPNGDGVNDYFIINDIDAFKPVNLTIYNRWGDIVYSSLDYKNGWDGKFDGKILPEGTYYYLIKTGKKVIKGTLNIIK